MFTHATRGNITYKILTLSMCPPPTVRIIAKARYQKYTQVSPFVKLLEKSKYYLSILMKKLLQTNESSILQANINPSATSSISNSNP